jgi:hypothetical protein
MGSSGVDHRAIARLMGNIQKEFDKHPITVPIQAEGPDVPSNYGVTHVYNGDGPVIQIQGDNAQLAWETNGTVQQGGQSQQIAPGFEAIAQALANTLQGLSGIGLSAEDETDARAAGAEALQEITAAQPDTSRIRRAVTALKGLLAPVAMGLSHGAAEGAQGWAHTAVEQLSQSWPT